MLEGDIMKYQPTELMAVYNKDDNTTYGGVWGKVRKMILERDNHRCVNCGQKANIIHHIHYENITEKDLVTLCRICHLETTFGRKFDKKFSDSPKLSERQRAKEYIERLESEIGGYQDTIDKRGMCSPAPHWNFMGFTDRPDDIAVYRERIQWWMKNWPAVYLAYITDTEKEIQAIMKLLENPRWNDKLSQELDSIIEEYEVIP